MNLITKIKNMRFEHKMKKQRAKYKYSEDMCWDFYDSFLDIIPKQIDKLIEFRNSHPDIEFKEIETFPIQWVNETLNELNKKDDKASFNINDTQSRWLLILSRISYCFKQANENTTKIKNEFEDSFFHLSYKLKEGDVPEDLKNNYFAKEKEIYEYRNNMKNEAFDLLKKYFWDLWD